MDSSPSSELNISKTREQKGFPYYEEMLNLFWIAVKRPETYQYDIVHGFNCSCCGRRIPQDSNDKAKPDAITNEPKTDYQNQKA